MADLARNLEERQEFWRPPAEIGAAARETGFRAEACDRCGSEYALGARFCHVCGSERSNELAPASRWRLRWFDLGQVRAATGLTTASLVAFLVGIVCAVAAIMTGLAFSATTLLDWQAIQIWRIEWLLAATAAFVAGILLKK